MKVCRAAIKWFMEENQDVYPYNDVPKTRQGYHPKWLLTMSINTENIVWRRMGYYVIKASCLNHGNLQNMIMDGDAIPLPAEFGEVVDSLETWGAFHWVGWLEHSLHLMHEYLKEDNMYGGVAPNKMRLFHDIILLHVQRELLFYWLSGTAQHNRVMENWNTYFWIRCRETYSFHELAVDSISSMEGMIRQISREERDGRASQIPSTPTNANMSPSSHAAVVAVSPSSMSYAGESTEE